MDRFCLNDFSLVLMAGQLAITLDTTALWDGVGGHYYVYTMRAPNLGFDVLGGDPGICTKGEYHGIKGYERRINNIATSLSDK